jgi:tetratricopeptide (TPR) repeat protein
MRNLQVIILYFLTVFLSTSMAIGQAKNTKDWPKIYNPKVPDVEIDYAKSKLESILLKCNTWNKENGYIVSSPIKVTVFDDRIELFLHGYPSDHIPIPDYSRTYYFSEILKYPIVGELYANPEIIVTLGSLRFSLIKVDNMEELADYLYYFQQHLDLLTNHQQYDSLITVFKPVAAQYRELKEKPVVTEEQRKYIVQANMFNQQKQYNRAIELYKKAVELNQTSYPAAYSNLALLSAQTQRFEKAIYYMTKYLLLEPDASDARSAQDKIYEWEAQITK